MSLEKLLKEKYGIDEISTMKMIINKIQKMEKAKLQFEKDEFNTILDILKRYV